MKASSPWDEDRTADRVERRVWRGADGEEIPYEKLGDERLRKILVYLRRAAMIERGLTVAALVSYRPGGEGAERACDDAMRDFLEETDAGGKEAEKAWRRHARPELDVLEGIARSRGLDLSFMRRDSAQDMIRAELMSLREGLWTA